MKQFKVGKIYGMNSICDSDCWWYYKVEARTASTITLRQIKSDGTPYKETIKCRINKQLSELRGNESCRPQGTFSMCPTLSADREFVTLTSKPAPQRKKEVLEERREAKAEEPKAIIKKLSDHGTLIIGGCGFKK